MIGRFKLGEQRADLGRLGLDLGLETLPEEALRAAQIEHPVGAPDDVEQMHEVDRFLEEILGAEAQSVDRLVDAAVSGHDDELDILLDLRPRGGEQLQPVAPRHLDVGEHDGGLGVLV